MTNYDASLMVCPKCSGEYLFGTVHHCPTNAGPFGVGRSFGHRGYAAATLKGWECPRCHSVYAPFVQECRKCNG